ncbi:membrane protein [Microbacterium phage Zhengyi]|nr:membrane protein [Microbacterium phage Zhengyi]QYC53809.1 membrane protein [Microbacterium phage EugeneKrabs]
MTDMSEDTASIAVLATKIDHVTRTLEEVKNTLATSSSVHVTRSEWELRNQTVDERFINMATVITEVKTSLQKQEDRKPSWWVIVSAVGTMLVAVGLAFTWIPQIIN